MIFDEVFIPSSSICRKVMIGDQFIRRFHCSHYRSKNYDRDLITGRELNARRCAVIVTFNVLNGPLKNSGFVTARNEIARPRGVSPKPRCDAEISGATMKSAATTCEPSGAGNAILRL